MRMTLIIPILLFSGCSMHSERHYSSVPALAPTANQWSTTLWVDDIEVRYGYIGNEYFVRLRNQGNDVCKVTRIYSNGEILETYLPPLERTDVEWRTLPTQLSDVSANCQTID
ncbi:hypothetical protein [Umboniibacter marinipuniceus]|uniref:Uncharacterized protein n=1 Tax=Umboniibacter marinipuniceus TaxID=569599 RepID=A0A3M0A2T6_9GAMM|nr:hypothetical protein [Umboniibacter marinipuniceus]RMA79481.1 hypothetical protein DFR27_1922 [Umboniibacter marinipuniceus]